MKAIQRFCLMLILLFMDGAVWALPKEEAVPGGMALVSLPGDLQGPVLYQDRFVLVWRRGLEAVAVVGIPLDAAPGVHELALPNGAHVPFTVHAKHYPVQRLKLPPRMVNPPQAQLARIEAESKKLQAARATYSVHEPESLDLALPVCGRLSTPFGLRRLLNGEPRQSHMGWDLAAPAGTVVHAPLSGRVLLTEAMYFSGNTVVVDHGSGLITLYGHLASMAVQPGEEVKAGDVIGRVGSTGRATGPHLHFALALNGTWVNPGVFLEQSLRRCAAGEGAGHKPDSAHQARHN
jgi:murein DD-endopeptidase MepM/ murein hydrolase activator NlpD